ncbi:hypothetical protein MPH_11930 [Macrophomina phaseolina MS6]|uniref:Uncharacterized protein n=1 Tax=Macrophomina phaseolina (strain MS6) TaxID=1126212 RepID=K2RDA5_MACPH|nr:hypothetical protein MPH_11930 [Macrophomina phaseolina MS6]
MRVAFNIICSSCSSYVLHAVIYLSWRSSSHNEFVFRLHPELEASRTCRYEPETGRKISPVSGSSLSPVKKRTALATKARRHTDSTSGQVCFLRGDNLDITDDGLTRRNQAHTVFFSSKLNTTIMTMIM